MAAGYGDVEGVLSLHYLLCAVALFHFFISLLVIVDILSAYHPYPHEV